MIGVVARTEMRASLRDGRVLASAAALSLLGLLALASAAARYAALAAERATAQRIVAAQWLEQGEKNPHSAAHYGVYAFRPALPLTFFDPGVSQYEGVAIWLEAHKRNFAIGRPADDMTPLLRFGELSLAFIFQALLPLGAILLGYGAFAAERESGTLRQVLAAGITPGRLFAGKFAGIAAALFVLSSPLLLLSVAALLVGSGTTWLLHALSLAAAHLGYAALVLLMSLVVSAWAKSAQRALLILLGFWAVTTFVLPRLGADLGRLVAPLPTLRELQLAIDQDLANGLDGIPPATRIEQRRAALLQIYNVTREQDLPINFQGVVLSIQDELGNAVYDKHFAMFESAVDSQVDLLEATSVLSPRLALLLLSQELAGASLAHQRHFARGAEEYRRRLMDVLNRDITFNSRPGQT
ncbi:MAG: DUF3526 domain-containing protein, partial [Steroidobacteraceae bacterium]|nr:DUF3526 domain-containing protein [Steroidobacteraceae bacterium]MDW8259613.1 DUF3526 domain-containing protein [Gammaproteobacteria bacterium]